MLIHDFLPSCKRTLPNSVKRGFFSRTLYPQGVLDSRKFLSEQHSILKAKKIENIYLALGSNIGDRVHNIEAACRQLEARGLRVVKTSNLYETQPMYLKDQHKFINAVCEVTSSSYYRAPAKLLALVKEIENDLGRVKNQDKGPRSIDIDILYIGDSTYEDHQLNIPHKSILEREFVLRPLAEYPMNTSGSLLWLTNIQAYYHLPANCLTVMEALYKQSWKAFLSHRPARLWFRFQTLLMGILNVTPDSFSDGDQYRNFNVDGIEQICQESQIILDVGGQSTRPGADLVTAEEELERVIPMLRHIHSHPRLEVILSVDTFRGPVARAAISEGAKLVNDISGGRLDTNILQVVAEENVSFVLMHSRGTPSTMSSLTSYPNGILNGVAEELEERVAAAQEAGVRRWRLILDPGLGFAKTYQQNLEIIRCLPQLRALESFHGIPWLMGPSRKSFVGRATGVKAAQDRIHGTSACVAASIFGGADIVRVHDMHQMAQVVKMSNSIWRQ